MAEPNEEMSKTDGGDLRKGNYWGKTNCSLQGILCNFSRTSTSVGKTLSPSYWHPCGDPRHREKLPPSQINSVSWQRSRKWPHTGWWPDRGDPEFSFWPGQESLPGETSGQVGTLSSWLGGSCITTEALHTGRRLLPRRRQPWLAAGHRTLVGSHTHWSTKVSRTRLGNKQSARHWGILSALELCRAQVWIERFPGMVVTAFSSTGNLY